MQGTINAKRVTFSDTRDTHRLEDMPFLERGETAPLLTDIGTPPIESAIGSAYVDRVVNGLKARAELRRARQPLVDLTLDEAYDFDSPMADLLSLNLFGIEDANKSPRGRGSEKAIRISLSHPVSTFIPNSIRENESKRHQIEEVDWDARIETMPQRASTEVMVMFEEGSYRPPRIVDDPEA